MAKIRQYQISWTKSVAEDVVGYKIYYVPEGEAMDYGSPSFFVGDVDTVLIPKDIPDFPLIDGNYQIGLTAVDDVEGESDFISKTVPLDLVAPDAPTNLEVTLL